jgi:hypothetical protein
VLRNAKSPGVCLYMFHFSLALSLSRVRVRALFLSCFLSFSFSLSPLSLSLSRSLCFSTHSQIQSGEKRETDRKTTWHLSSQTRHHSPPPPPPPVTVCVCSMQWQQIRHHLQTTTAIVFPGMPLRVPPRPPL